MSFVSIAKKIQHTVSSKPEPKKTRSWLQVQSLEDRITPAVNLVDRNSTLLGSGNGPAVILGTSEDGRYAIFSSKANDLIQGQNDIPSTNDLFWTDLFTSEIKLVTNLPTLENVNGTPTYTFDGKTSYSRVLSGSDMFGPAKNTDGTTTPFGSAVISADGKFVGFTSKINVGLIDPLYVTKTIAPTIPSVTRSLDADRGSTTLDVFRWEAQTSKTELVSRSFDAGTQSNEAFGRRTDSINPGISSDGTRVTFVSQYSAQDALPVRPASNLITGSPGPIDNDVTFLVFDNGDASNDIFVTDMQEVDVNFTRYKTAVISKLGTGLATYRVINPTPPPNIINTPLTPRYDTFGSKSSVFGIDPFGRYVAGDGLSVTFTSDVDPAILNTQLNNTVGNYTATGSKTGRANVWFSGFGATSSGRNNNDVRIVSTALQDPTAKTVTTIAGVGGNAQSAIISRNDNRGILFSTSAGGDATQQLVAGFAGDTSRQELYFRRINSELGTTPILVTAKNGTTNVSSATGTLQFGPTAGDITSGLVNPRGFSLSASGNAVVFTHSSPTLITTKNFSDTNGTSDVFVKDLTTNVLTLASVTPTGLKAGTKAAFNPQISADERYVTFESVSTEYVLAATTTDTNGVSDIFLRDRTTNSTALISATANGASAGNAPSFGAFVGSSGFTGRVAFTSSATNLDINFPPAPGNTDVYLVNLPLAGIASGDPPLKAARSGVVSGGTFAAASAVTFGSSNELIFGSKFTPFPGFTGEIRVASGDVNNDMAVSPDIIMASGPGGAPRVVVVDGMSGATIYNLTVFESSFLGGLNVTAADYNGDGFVDIAVAADIGGGPRIKVIDGKTAATIADFFVFEPAFRGGVRLASGFVGSLDAQGNGISVDDGIPDLIAGAGIGGGPRISVLDGLAVTRNQIARITDYFAFEQSLRNGVYVAAGDFNKDTFDDIVAGAGPGGGPRVQVFDAKNAVFTPGSPSVLINFFSFDDSSRKGVRVAVKNIDGDSVADILTGEGSGNISRIRSFSGGRLDSTSRPNQLDDRVLFDDFGSLNGAWVG